MRAPTNNRVTQGKHGTYNAVDYSWSPDPNIYAPENGTISFYGKAGDCGNNLQLVGASGTHGFCHLEKATVTTGQKVTKGQVIGVMGYTGLTIPKGPAGRHLHWVLRKGNLYVYPPNYVNESSTPTKSQGEDMIRDVDNEYGRWAKLGRQIRGRNLSRSEFRKAAVGLTWLRAMEVLSDNPESNQNVEDGNLGRVARKDNWQGKITNLTAKVNELNTRPTKAELDAVKAKADKLEQQVKDGVSGISEEDSAAIKETNSIVKAIQALLSKIFK